MDAAAAAGRCLFVTSCCSESRCSCFLASLFAGGLFVEIGDCFGGGAEESDFEFRGRCLEDCIQTSWRERSFLHSWLWGYEELLIVYGDVEDSLYFGGEVL